MTHVTDAFDFHSPHFLSWLFSQDVVDIVATLLAVDRDELAYAITTRTNYINNEKFIVPLNTREAEVSLSVFFFFFFFFFFFLD